MAAPSQVEQPANAQAIAALESQLRESFGKVAYSHKVHEKDADRYFARGRALKTTQILLSAITTGGILAILFGEGRVAAIISAIASTTLLIISTYTKELNLGELAQRHSETATRLWSIRESYLSLITDLQGSDVLANDIRFRRDQLQEDLAAIYANAPRTSPQAYAAAQKALKVNEELTFSEAEIDRLLPPSLKRSEQR